MDIAVVDNFVVAESVVEDVPLDACCAVAEDGAIANKEVIVRSSDRSSILTAIEMAFSKERKTEHGKQEESTNAIKHH